MKNTIMATSLLVARYLGRGKQGKLKNIIQVKKLTNWVLTFNNQFQTPELEKCQ